MGTLSKIGIKILMVSLLTLPLLAACGGGNEDEATIPTQTTTQPTISATKKVITIGNHTDLTGPASVAMEYVNAGLEDAARYYNENALIPGVEVKVVEYDGQLDPSKDIPGWLRLKERGADVIVGWFPAIGISLRPSAERDKIPLFISNAPAEALDPPGYVFNTSPLQAQQAWTLIKWIMENHWDYRTKGPAKVGGAGDEMSNFRVFYEQFEKYAEMYPERMEWVAGLIAPRNTFQWDNEVEALKDCDYIFVPNIIPSFVKSYAAAGHDKATFIATDSAMSWFSLVDDMGLWPKIEGMLFISLTEWWGEDAEFPNLVSKVLHEYRPGSVEAFMAGGTGYNSFGNGIQILEGIKAAAAAVGPENVDSQAIYEGMQSVKISWDGIQRWSYGETKRSAADRLGIYQADGPGKTLVRVSEWLPVEMAP